MTVVFRSVGRANRKPPDDAVGGRLVVPELAGTDHIENSIGMPLAGLVRCPVGRTPPAAIRRRQRWFVGYRDVADSQGQRTRVLLSGPVRRRQCLPGR